MSTVDCLSEDDGRVWVREAMRSWLGHTVVMHGYIGVSWTDCRNGRKAIQLDHEPICEPRPLPERLPLDEIERLDSRQAIIQKGAPGSDERRRWINSQLLWCPNGCCELRSNEKPSLLYSSLNQHGAVVDSASDTTRDKEHTALLNRDVQHFPAFVNPPFFFDPRKGYCLS